MPATDYQGSSASFSHLGRSILSQGGHQVHSMEGSNNYHNDPATSLEVALEVFQRQVTDRFLDLSSAGHDDLLSLPWLRKLLDTFLFCQEEFRDFLSNHRAFVLRSPTNKGVSDYYERSLKALDVCNAIRDGIEQIRQWLKLLDIVLCALDNQKSIGEGQFRRAKRALVDLAIGMIDNKDSNAAIPHRNRSFGRNSGSREHHHTNPQHRSLDHFRSLSWSVSRTWSAAKQLQAIGNNLSPPRGTELVATNGLAAAVYTMNSILLFVMWALVAAIPCQDRGLQVHFSIPRQFTWAAPILSLHEKIMEESKKKDWKNACGLLKEIHQIEKFARVINELADSVQFPLSETKDGEVREKVQELSQLCEVIKGGLDPLERQVREVFRRIVRSRTEGLDSLGRYLTSD